MAHAMASQPKSTLVLASFLLLASIVASVAYAGAVYTNTECSRSCSSRSTPRADNWRALGNKVSDDYQGDTDCWASSGGNVFATNVRVYRGQAWPRISEGVVSPNQRTPGYPITLNTYLTRGNRYISYKGQWTSRSHGPHPRPAPRGPLYNGAYIWLNKADNFHPGGVNPKWPFSVEVNIWNRYDNGIDRVTPFPAYYDSNGKYEVSGGWVQRGPVRFFAYFVVNVTNKGMSGMVINTTKLLKHLRDRCRLDGRLKIIEMTVAAEGHAGADAKLIANIATMGRP